MLDETLRKVRSVDLPWDDLRERRVLARVVDRPAPTVPWPWLGVAVATALAAIATAVVLREDPAPDRALPALVRNEIAPAQIRRDLPDGSTAVGSGASSLRVGREVDGTLEVDQPSGTVRYEVVPAPGRRFVVHAAGIRVEVVGTVFSVGVEERGTRVRVERGRVHVHDGARGLDLVAGEDLFVRPLGLPQPEPPPPAIPSSARAAAVPSVAAPPSLEDFVERADRARADGRLEEAAALLRTATDLHGSEPGAATASFTLGRVERSLGRFDRAAEAFHRAGAAARGSLAEDALVEEAQALFDAGRFEESRAAARLYLERHPEGVHVPRVAPLAE